MRAFSALISALVVARCAAFIPSGGARPAASFAGVGSKGLQGGRRGLHQMARRARPQHQREEVRAMRGGGMAGGAPQQYDGEFTKPTAVADAVGDDASRGVAAAAADDAAAAAADDDDDVDIAAVFCFCRF